MNALKRIDDALGKLEEWVAALLLLAILLLAVAQVVARNVFHRGFTEADEAVRQLTFLLGLTGAAIATREGRHINVEVVGKLLSKRRQLLVGVVVGLFACATSGWLALGGFYQTAIAIKKETEAVIGPVKSWHLQASVPIGYAVFALHFLLRVVCDVGRLVGGQVDEQPAAAPEAASPPAAEARAEGKAQ